MLWRQVVGFRRNVCELKNGTERSGSAECARLPAVALCGLLTPFLPPTCRDLSDMRGELARGFHSVQVSCSGLSSALHSREAGAALALEREKSLRLQLEQQLREHVGEAMGLQTRADAERSGLSLRWVSGLGRLAKSLGNG